MVLPEIYEKKIAEYSESLKIKHLPLLSWDVHMQNLKRTVGYKHDIDFIRAFDENRISKANILQEFVVNGAVIVVTDKNLNIEFASNNIVAMTGYQANEVIGKTPKIFQGPETDKKILKLIRISIDKEESFDHTIVNYRKNKTTYDCHIKAFPVYDKKGNLVKFVAIEKAA